MFRKVGAPPKAKKAPEPEPEPPAAVAPAGPASESESEAESDSGSSSASDQAFPPPPPPKAAPFKAAPAPARVAAPTPAPVVGRTAEASTQEERIAQEVRAPRLPFAARRRRFVAARPAPAARVEATAHAAAVGVPGGDEQRRGPGGAHARPAASGGDPPGPLRLHLPAVGERVAVQRRGGAGAEVRRRARDARGRRRASLARRARCFSAADRPAPAVGAAAG